MKRITWLLWGRFAVFLLGTFLLCGSLRSQENEGSVIVEILPESDSIVSIPFLRPAVFESSVLSVEGNVLRFPDGVMENRAFIQSSGISRFGLFIESGVSQGRHFDIVSNDSSEIVLSGFDEVILQFGDLVSVRTYWTLGSAFFEGGGMLPTDEIGRRSIELILLESGVSEGLCAKRVYYYYNGAWRKLGRCPKFRYDSVVLETGSAFVLRNNNPTSESAEFVGIEAGFSLAEELFVSLDSVVDNFTSTGRLGDVSLSNLGLGADVFLESLDPLFPLDLLLVYDNRVVGKNRNPSNAYYYFNDGWRKVGEDVSVDFGSDLIQDGAGIAIRKAAGDGESLFWFR